MLYTMTDKGGCKIGKKAPEGSPKGGCKEGLKAKPKKKLVLKLKPQYAKKKVPPVPSNAETAKVIAPKKRVPMVAKVMKAKPKKKLVLKVKPKEALTIGKSLTGLSKEEMNKLSPLELFGKLPVSVAKIVLDPKTTGVKVAKQKYTNNDLIDLVLKGAGRKEMPTKEFILQWIDKSAKEFDENFPSDERRRIKKKVGNFYKEVKSYFKIASNDRFKTPRELPDNPRELGFDLTRLTQYLNKDSEFAIKMKMELFKLGSNEYRNEVKSKQKEIKKGATAEKDKKNIEESLEEMKDSDFKDDMYFKIGGETWYGDGPGQGGGWLDQLWQLTSSNNKTGKVTLKFIKHRGSQQWHRDKEPPKQKTKTLLLNKIWSNRRSAY